MSGPNHKQHVLESTIKSNFIRYVRRFYPTSHPVIIPASYWRQLPYDCYILWNGIFRAIELKVDDNSVEPHQYEALFEVVKNKGYAFVVRWLNGGKKFVVDNYTNGTAEIFRGEPSTRQLTGKSPRSEDDQPFYRESAYKQLIDYLMSFNVTPLEEEIQSIVNKNWKNLLDRVRRIK